MIPREDNDTTRGSCQMIRARLKWDFGGAPGGRPGSQACVRATTPPATHMRKYYNMFKLMVGRKTQSGLWAVRIFTSFLVNLCVLLIRIITHFTSISNRSSIYHLSSISISHVTSEFRDLRSQSQISLCGHCALCGSTYSKCL